MIKILLGGILVSILGILFSQGVMRVVETVQAQRAPVQFTSGEVMVVPTDLNFVVVIPPVPDFVTLEPGQTFTFIALCQFGDGTPPVEEIDCSDIVVWSSSDPSVVTIHPDTGVATGVSIGRVAITAGLR